MSDLAGADQAPTMPDQTPDPPAVDAAPEPAPVVPEPAAQLPLPGADVAPVGPTRTIRPVQLTPEPAPAPAPKAKPAPAAPAAPPAPTAPEPSPQQRAAATLKARRAAEKAAAAPAAAAAQATVDAVAAATGVPSAQVQLIGAMLSARASAIGGLVCSAAGWPALSADEAAWLDATYPAVEVSAGMAKIIVPIVIFGPRIQADPRVRAWWSDRQRSQRIAAIAQAKAQGVDPATYPWYAEHQAGELARMRAAMGQAAAPVAAPIPPAPAPEPPAAPPPAGTAVPPARGGAAPLTDGAGNRIAL